MKKPSHFRPADLHGLGRAATDAVAGVVDLVEALHATIARPSAPLARATPPRTRGITGLVYRSVRGVNRAVALALDSALAPLAQWGADTPHTPEREVALAILNGVLGDYLADSGNPLALPMRLRCEGRALQLDAGSLAGSLAQPTADVVVLVHGLCMNDRQWQPRGDQPASPGLHARLRQAGYTPLDLHYNSGRPIAHNGRDFATLLEHLMTAWPQPLRSLSLLGHSMGGLVSRSACHIAEQDGLSWRRSLRRMVFLGTPHHGAPLERGGNWIDQLLEASPYSRPFARIGQIRSAGITDLRHGHVRAEDGAGHGRFASARDARLPLPLPVGVDCCTVAATGGTATGDLRDRWLGDGLVPLDSALGRHRDPAFALAFASDRQWIARDLGHLALLWDRAVHEQVLGWMAQPE